MSGSHYAQQVSPFIHQAGRIKGEMPGIQEMAFSFLYLEGPPAADLWLKIGKINK